MECMESSRWFEDVDCAGTGMKECFRGLIPSLSFLLLPHNCASGSDADNNVRYAKAVVDVTAVRFWREMKQAIQNGADDNDLYRSDLWDERKYELERAVPVFQTEAWSTGHGASHHTEIRFRYC